MHKLSYRPRYLLKEQIRLLKVLDLYPQEHHLNHGHRRPQLHYQLRLLAVPRLPQSHDLQLGLEVPVLVSLPRFRNLKHCAV